SPSPTVPASPSSLPHSPFAPASFIPPNPAQRTLFNTTRPLDAALPPNVGSRPRLPAPHNCPTPNARPSNPRRM
ncbi:hypothetical protein FRC12_012727, partial [Ceratobasidium sp. 428]